jgi:hypothetical protein
MSFDQWPEGLGLVCERRILGHGTMLLFQISTIDPSEVFTSRSNRVRISIPTFQGLDVFFWEMLAEHSS